MLAAAACRGLTRPHNPSPKQRHVFACVCGLRCYPAAPMHKPLLPPTLALLTLLNTAGCMHGAPRKPATPVPATSNAPTPKSDPVLQWLQDKGQVPAQGPGSSNQALLQRLRDGANDLVLLAMNFLGVLYKHGGNNAEQGFDCSGFTRHVFQNSLGLVLPRRSEQQAHHAALQSVKPVDLRPGDLVFFNTQMRAFSHVGIFVGEGHFIHSPRVGGEVRIEDMRMTYWAQRFDGARRAPSKDRDAASLAAAKSAN
jgi:cell wall-associated NlpC family hydrolase